jgi:glucose/arabinose dehydrogenase
MAGGRLADAGNGKVVLGSGDYAWDGLYAPKALAQDLSNDYGKVIEIDLVLGSHRIVSYGHRNMQGVVVDRDGQIWVVEHGARGGDELNRITDGLNYGWPIETLGTRYNKLPWPSEGTYGRHDVYTLPAYAWVPSAATSSLMQIENFHPSWDGDLLVGTFKGGRAYRIRVQDERVIFAEPLQLIDGRIRDIHQHPDGRIVVWSDAETVTFVSPGEPVMSDNLIEEVLEMADFTDDEAGKIKTTMSLCLECWLLRRAYICRWHLGRIKAI